MIVLLLAAGAWGMKRVMPRVSAGYHAAVQQALARRARMSEVALQLDDVHKRFGATPIIRGLNLSVKTGERHAIIGPNGAGKVHACSTWSAGAFRSARAACCSRAKT